MAGGQLRWAVRESLLGYITRIARGSYEVTGGAREEPGGAFAFPVTRVVREGQDWRITCAGSVRLLAHHGLMDILVRDPELVLGPQGGVLATRLGEGAAEAGDAASSTKHADAPGAHQVPDAGGGLLAMVALGASSPRREPTAEGETLAWEGVPTTLAPGAVDLFGTVYPAGTEMAPLGIELTLHF